MIRIDRATAKAGTPAAWPPRPLGGNDENHNPFPAFVREGLAEPREATTQNSHQHRIFGGF